MKSKYCEARSMAVRVTDLESRIEQYKEEEQDFIEGLKASMERSYELATENARLREALRFYGDEESWRWEDDDSPSPCWEDAGERARKALGE